MRCRRSANDGKGKTRYALRKLAQAICNQRGNNNGQCQMQTPHQTQGSRIVAMDARQYWGNGLKHRLNLNHLRQGSDFILKNALEVLPA